MQTASLPHAATGQLAVCGRAQPSQKRSRCTSHARTSSQKLSSSARISTISSLAPRKATIHQRPCTQRVMAFEREWPEPEFIREVEEAFPDQGIANVEESRALVSSLGWTYLDVRSKLETEDVGKVRIAVNIPCVNCTKKWSSEQGKKVIQKEENEAFLAMVEKRFPDKESKILVGCSNGRQYTMDVLLALDEEGYTNLAGLKGGFYAWNSVFDGKLNRRRTGEYAETYTHDGDSAGIHSSGAGFPKMDPADKFVGQEY